MKKTYLILMGMLLMMGMAFSQTAVNFTANDCNGNSHDLFTELNSGKIVVISFVMPCGTCIAPTLAADAAVQSYASSNPGQVLFYVSDDLGTTSCSTLNSWESTNSITSDATFANTAVKMSQYGTGTMNRVVVLGGTSHTVYYNVGSGVSQSAIQSAINTALSATGINDNSKVDFQLSIFPNPVTDKFSVTYSLLQSDNIKLEVVNLLGEKVKEIVSEKQSAGQHESSVGTEDMNAGVYFLKVTANDFSQLVKFTVSH
ncbi:MAG: T9SS type A sorting domain-containing protein [Bacteroidota bacterium]